MINVLRKRYKSYKYAQQRQKQTHSQIQEEKQKQTHSQIQEEKQKQTHSQVQEEKQNHVDFYTSEIVFTNLINDIEWNSIMSNM
jgi:septal ring factor EnvC (AmiA/AmiB activator)